MDNSQRARGETERLPRTALSRLRSLEESGKQGGRSRCVPGFRLARSVKASATACNKSKGSQAVGVKGSPSFLLALTPPGRRGRSTPAQLGALSSRWGLATHSAALARDFSANFLLTTNDSLLLAQPPGA